MKIKGQEYRIGWLNCGDLWAGPSMMDRFAINSDKMQIIIRWDLEMSRHKEEAKKLQTKYLQDEQFQKQMDDRYKKYQLTLQQSLYSDLSSICEDLFVCYNRGECPVYFYFGALQNSSQDNLHKLAMFFIKFFTHKPTQHYIFVFINTKAESDAYGHFKQIFLRLTIDHFLQLKQFILVRPTYYHRAQDYMSFCYLTNYLRNLTRHFYTCADLCTYLNMSEQDFVDLVPKEISQFQFPKLIPRKMSLEDQRINFEGQLLDEKERVLKRQFEKVMKSFLIMKPGKETYNISDYEVNKFGIPVVLAILVFYFKTHPQGLDYEGLFRKSVSIDEQNETLNQLSNKNYDCLLSVSNPHIIANLIKRFFSNLKTPVIPYSQFEILMHDQGVSDKKQHVKAQIQTLPELNYQSLMFLLQFLRDDVISRAAFNKMTAQNIAICFAPCLLRAEKASAADIIYASKCAIVTRILLDHFEDIFGSRLTIEKMYRQSEQHKAKDINTQIEESIKAERNERLSNHSNTSSNKNDKEKLATDQSKYQHNRVSQGQSRQTQGQKLKAYRLSAKAMKSDQERGNYALSGVIFV